MILRDSALITLSSWVIGHAFAGPVETAVET